MYDQAEHEVFGGEERAWRDPGAQQQGGTGGRNRRLLRPVFYDDASGWLFVRDQAKAETIAARGACCIAIPRSEAPRDRATASGGTTEEGGGEDVEGEVVTYEVDFDPDNSVVVRRALDSL